MRLWMILSGLAIAGLVGALVRGLVRYIMCSVQDPPQEPDA